LDYGHFGTLIEELSVLSTVQRPFGGLPVRQIGRGLAVYLSLLKIQFGAIEGRDGQAASPILRGSTLIAMMQAANLGGGSNVIACGG
jgi:hypothetical protein